MRWTWVLALGLGLGLAALAKADDDDAKPAAKTGNWFTRLFVRDPAPKNKATVASKDEAAKPAPPSPALARKKAEWELLRRQEVCEKLRQIALQTSDKDLARKADDLDQRAWDIYVQRAGGPRRNLSPDELILDAAHRSANSSTSGSAALANADGRTAARRD